MFTLGRKIDLGYRPNQIIVIVTLLSALSGLLYTSELLSGLAIGGGVFSTWALSRELDPRHEFSAFVASAFSLVMIVYYDSIQLLVIAWLLLLLRMTNGITGKKLTIIDVLSVLALTATLTFSEETSLYLITFILSMLYFIISRERMTLTLSAGAVGLVLLITQTIFQQTNTFMSVAGLTPLTLFAISAVSFSFIVFWFISEDECEDDEGNKVNRLRLFTTQVLFNLSMILLLVFGEISLTNMIIYLSVIIGLTLYFVFYKLVKKSDAMEEKI